MPPAAKPNTPPPRIYISYRPEDGAAYATKIYNALADKFGTQSVYMYRTGGTSSLDRKQKIQDEVDKADVMLMVITRGWLNSVNRQGTRRLEDPNDPVVIEIEEGLKRDKQGGFRFIMVLEDEQLEPQRHQLQPRLRDLVGQESVTSTGNFDELIEKIVEKLGGESAPEISGMNKGEKKPSRNWDVLGRHLVFALVVLSLIGISFYGSIAIFRSIPQQTANFRVGVLLDVSAGMSQTASDGLTYLQTSLRSIARYSDWGIGPGDWIGVRTIGGGTTPDCGQTQLVVSGILGDELQRENLERSLRDLNPGGNTAYEAGFDGIEEDIGSESTTKTFLIAFLASDRPSTDCTGRDTTPISFQLLIDRLERQNIELRVCAFTFFEESAAIDQIREQVRIINNGDDCFINNPEEEQIGSEINTVVQSLRDQPPALTPTVEPIEPTLTSVPTTPPTATTPAPTPTPLASPTTAPTATQPTATATASTTPEPQSGVQFTVFVDENSLTVYVPDPSPDIPGDTVSLAGLEFQVIFNGSTIIYSLQQQFNSISLTQVPLPACFRLVRNGETPAIPSACPGTAIYSQFVAPADVFWARNGQSIAFTVLNSGMALGVFPAGQFQASFNLTVPIPSPTSTPTLSPTSPPTFPPSCTAALSFALEPTFITTNGVTHTDLITIAEFDDFKLAGGYQQQMCWEQPNGWAWAVNSGRTVLPAPTTVPPNEPPDAPRVNLEWWEADAYCAAQGGRLPDADEWLSINVTSLSNVDYEWLSSETSFSVIETIGRAIGVLAIDSPNRVFIGFRCVRP